MIGAERLGANCRECPLQDSPGMLPKQVTNPTRKLLALVTDYPGKVEVEKNDFLVGPTGGLVRDHILSPTGIPSHQIHMTGAILCSSLNFEMLDTKAQKKAIECCRPRLVNEIKRVSPKAILTTGKTACESVLHKPQLNDFLGAPAQAPNGLSKYPVIPTLQPAMMFRERWGYLPVFRSHFIRAWELASGELEPWTWRKHIWEVGPDMLDALQDMRADVAADIETHKGSHLTVPITVIGICDRDVAVAVPWGYNPDDPDGEACENPQSKLTTAIHKQVVRILTTARLKVWQNGRFDRFILRRHGILVHPKTNRDTMLMHTILAPNIPHDLGFQACVEFPAPRWKQDHEGFRKDGFDK